MKLIKREEKEVIQYLYGKYLTGELDLEAFKLQISAVEIVDDDKDWKLSEQEEPQLSGTKFNAKWNDDIIKCRDLILEDISKVDEYKGYDITVEEVVFKLSKVIHKRFGELK